MRRGVGKAWRPPSSRLDGARGLQQQPVEANTLTYGPAVGLGFRVEVRTRRPTPLALVDLGVLRR